MVIIGDEFDTKRWVMIGRPEYTRDKVVHIPPNEVWIFRNGSGLMLGLGTELRDIRDLMARPQWNEFEMTVQSMRRPK